MRFWQLQKTGKCLVLLAMSATCVCANQLIQADVIERRGAEPPIEGTVVKVDDAGVTIDRSTAEHEFVRWDRVRSLQASRFARETAEYQELAENLWRARSRLERGDTTLSEPIFERLFERYRGQTHETALIVSEGLLRCRLARGAHDAAIVPALETIRIRRKVPTSASVYNTLKPVIDGRTWLCSALPPAFVMSPGLVRVERELDAYDARGDVLVQAQAQLYQQAIRQQLGTTPAPNHKPLAAGEPGIELLTQVIALSSPEADRRSTARQAVIAQLENFEPWLQAWAHHAIGISLLAESGDGRRHAGMVHLAHLPARFAHEQSFLAGLSLAELARALDAAGESASAEAIRRELQQNFPNHPAIAIANAQQRPATSPNKST